MRNPFFSCKRDQYHKKENFFFLTLQDLCSIAHKNQFTIHKNLPNPKNYQWKLMLPVHRLSRSRFIRHFLLFFLLLSYRDVTFEEFDSLDILSQQKIVRFNNKKDTFKYGKSNAYFTSLEKCIYINKPKREVTIKVKV